MYVLANKKNNVYHCNLPFYYIKVEFKGSKLYRRVFVMFRLDTPNITKTRLFNYIGNFTTKKMKFFR